jgi:uncharacterized MAPEG superfamily protein
VNRREHEPPNDPADPDEPNDPVLAQRARVARLVRVGQNVGYGLFAAFAVIVIVGFATGFPSTVTVSATICLILGSVVLAPAIVFGYAVKAADRADREDDWR